jgi:hypothetical protein
MLADLYVPAGTNPADPKLPEDQPEEEVEEEVQTQEAAETSVEVRPETLLLLLRTQKRLLL